VDHYPDDTLGRFGSDTLPVSNIPLSTPGNSLDAAWKRRERIICVVDSPLPGVVKRARSGAHHKETACPPHTAKDTHHFTTLYCDRHNLHLAGIAATHAGSLLAVPRT